MFFFDPLAHRRRQWGFAQLDAQIATPVAICGNRSVTSMGIRTARRSDRYSRGHLRKPVVDVNRDAHSSMLTSLLSQSFDQTRAPQASTHPCAGPAGAKCELHLLFLGPPASAHPLRNMSTVSFISSAPLRRRRPTASAQPLRRERVTSSFFFRSTCAGTAAAK